MSQTVCGRCFTDELAIDDETGLCVECLFEIMETLPRDEWPWEPERETQTDTPSERYL